MAIAKMGVRTFHLIYYILFTLCWTPYVYHATIRLIFLFFYLIIREREIGSGASWSSDDDIGSCRLRLNLEFDQ